MPMMMKIKMRPVWWVVVAVQERSLQIAGEAVGLVLLNQMKTMLDKMPMMM